MARKGITLVLGGLGLKGVSHIGTLQAFNDHGVRINRIVAAGASSLVAVQFAIGGDLKLLSEYFTHFFKKNHRYLWGLERLNEIKRSRTKRVRDSFSYFLRERLYCQANFKKISLLEWDRVEYDLLEYFGKMTFFDLNIPLSISTIDLTDGKEVLLQDGRLSDAIKAGIAFPGLFPPVVIMGREYISSTFYCELPLASVQNNGDPIVVVDIPNTHVVHRPGTIIETLARVDELRSKTIKRNLLKKADIVYTLESLRGYPWGNYKHIPLQILRANQEMDMLLTSANRQVWL